MSGRPTTANSSRPYTAASSDYRPQTAWSESEPPSTAHGGAATYAYPTQQYHQQHHNHLYAQEEEDEEEESEEEDVFAYLPPGTAQSDVAAPNQHHNGNPQQQHVQFAHHTQQRGAFGQPLQAQQPENMQPPQDQQQPPSAAAFHNLVAAAGLDPGPTPPYSQSNASSRYAPSGIAAPAPTTTGQTDSNYGDFGPDAYDMRPIPFSPGGPGMFPPVSATNKSFGRSVDSREVRVDLPSTGVSFSSSNYNPASPGPVKRRISSELGTSIGDMATTLKYTEEVGGEEAEEEDSPYPEVRASVSNTDDTEMPAATIRMWVLGMFLCLIAISLNTFFNFRFPSPTLTPLVILLIAYPCGRFLAAVLPIRTYQLPAWLGGARFSLNPGPFNVKEHVLIFIMSNISAAPSFSLNTIVVSELYYKLDFGAGFNLCLILSTQMMGLGFAGFGRRFLVWPASMVWPSNLVSCTLLNTLHAGEETDRRSGISRYRFFIYATVASFAWAFLPTFLFQALGYFSWICWIAPTNLVVNQLFGTVSGLGMGILTFDWAQISWIGSPLMVPWWAQLHVFAGFAFFYWFLLPILYYKNAWHLAYMPMTAQASFDRFGRVYNISAIFNRTTRSFSPEAYNEYSSLYLPGPFLLVYLLAFAISTALIVHTVLYNGRTLINGFKKIQVEEDDIHAKLMRAYPEVPDKWYATLFAVFFVIAVLAVEVWPTGMPVWTLAIAVLLPAIYMLPCGFIFAVTGQGLSINLLAQIFKAVAIQTLGSSLAFVQDLKFGHYIKVPPRAVFMAQTISALMGAIVQVGVKRWLFANVPDICSQTQKDALTCPHNQVFFNASAIWGLIGPARQFGEGTLYHGHLYAMLVGALLPVPIWLYHRFRPKTRLRYLNIPVLLNGPTFSPPARGINFSSWFVVGFIFQYFIRRRNFRWWSKFNYVLSAALDSGTILSIIIIFLTLQLPFKNGGLLIDWWGNSADGAFKTYDVLQPPLYRLRPGEAFDVAPNGQP
ncbi:Glutathione transporter 1 [Serendipita indica DSM 11827]|uniref:Probable oligopeptide transporter (C-terminal) n=1 Tax=Serendipita indica (strain DSM 11827) TaxID=1109443 RepID=G4TAR4_SERID|nr:Glutathione transporter 1 [Serendipita indica DSM 11827]CCA68407.1 probable oligopeptide transporter (C-terminal fragment) [Serendipita indica DSM 11827]